MDKQEVFIFMQVTFFDFQAITYEACEKNKEHVAVSFYYVHL